MNLFDMIITRPMGFIIEHIYGFVQNYGWAIIIFTVLIKLVVLPLRFSRILRSFRKSMLMTSRSFSRK